MDLWKLVTDPGSVINQEWLKTLLPESLHEWIPYAWVLVTIGALAAFLPATMMFLTWLERKVIARMQDRVGPNRVGPWGLLQPIADGIKMVWKEDTRPLHSDVFIHFAAPVLVVAPVFVAFLVLPFAKNTIAADLNIGVLFFVSITSLEAMAVLLAGWGPRNKFSLLGAMRTAAQVVSYEVPLTVALVAVVMASGSMSTVSIVETQHAQGFWYVATPWGLAAFVIFFTCGLAEMARTPFDLPEAESELVAGFHAEYSGMKFAMFQMAEFLSGWAICALAVALFFGGWYAPFGLPGSGVLWFLGKTYAFFFVLIWSRGTLARFRIDQVLNFAWKFMLPFGLVVIFATAAWMALPGVVGWVVCGAIILAAWVGFSALFPHRVGKFGRALAATKT